MISLINLQNLSPKQYFASVILYSSVHVLLFSILITQYYIKILEHILLSFNITNMHRKALLHAIFINIPRTYFLFNTNLYNQGCFLNGFTTLNLSVGLGILLLCTHSRTWIQFNSFLKDLFSLNGGIIIQVICMQEERFTDLQKNLAGVLFGIFLFGTIKLKDASRQDLISTSVPPFSFLKRCNRYFAKYIYDLTILDLENFHKQSFLTSMQTLFSPVINTGVFLFYFRRNEEIQNILIGLFFAMMSGFVLVKCSKKQPYQIINYIYGLLCTMFYTVIFIDRFRLLISAISGSKSISEKYLNTAIMPAIASLPELLNLSYYSLLNKSAFSVCALFDSIILNSICFSPLRKILSGSINTKYIGDRISISFSAISIIVMFFNYVMKNQKLSKDLGCILVFIYLLYNLTFILDYGLFIGSGL